MAWPNSGILRGCTFAREDSPWSRCTQLPRAISVCANWPKRIWKRFPLRNSRRPKPPRLLIYFVRWRNIMRPSSNTAKGSHPVVSHIVVGEIFRYLRFHFCFISHLSSGPVEAIPRKRVEVSSAPINADLILIVFMSAQTVTLVL